MKNTKYNYLDNENLCSLMQCAKMFDMGFNDFITFMCTIGIGYLNKRNNCFMPYRKYSKFKNERKPYFVIKYLPENIKLSYVTKEVIKYMKSLL